jgi:hypothetical protein
MMLVFVRPVVPAASRTEPVSVCVPLGAADVGHGSVTGPFDDVVWGVPTALPSAQREGLDAIPVSVRRSATVSVTRAACKLL